MKLRSHTHTQIHKLNARNWLHARKNSKHTYNCCTYYKSSQLPWISFVKGWLVCMAFSLSGWSGFDSYSHSNLSNPETNHSQSSEGGWIRKILCHAQHMETFRISPDLFLSLSLTTLRPISATGPSEKRAVTHSHTWAPYHPAKHIRSKLELISRAKRTFQSLADIRNPAVATVGLLDDLQGFYTYTSIYHLVLRFQPAINSIKWVFKFRMRLPRH